MAARSPTDSFLAAAVANLRQLNADLARSEDSGLSPAEAAFIPEAKARPWKPKGLPVAEIDCDLRIPGQGEVAVTLAIWGTFTRAFHSRDREEPDEPAGFDVHAVMIGETDILGDIGEAGEREIVRYVMENCE
jgi:hypothetical protein